MKSAGCWLAEVWTETSHFCQFNPLHHEPIENNPPSQISTAVPVTESLRLNSHQRPSSPLHIPSSYFTPERRACACFYFEASGFMEVEKSLTLMAFHFRAAGSKHSTFGRVRGCRWYPLYMRLKFATECHWACLRNVFNSFRPSLAFTVKRKTT